LETWGWAGWRFWWRNRDLYQLLVNGINAPAVYRLFDSGRGRKPWKDAMNSIERTQQEVKAIKEAWKDNIPAHGVVTDS
jgi:dimethylaniline monooxygenase (N-oxide forming)